ncbi:hypothetical protein Pmani_027995 [Petrolisthes manimaculis]|uniref:Uncharacterized protein n=1 Tax=Petrolisthes manimaculis TaxID=1843537 RepID=A0AAE1P0Z0_9EUCA|nr:hypothetical protein Pmani_027995 [Petrolisthes manimaculis]
MTEGEVGEPVLDTILQKLATWSEEEFTANMTVNFLNEDTRIISEDLKKQYMQYNSFISCLFFYLIKLDVEAGCCLLMGFNLKVGKHKAIGRRNWNEPVLVMEREELEAREFLTDIRPLMKGLEDSMTTNFLKYFTDTNPVR